MEKQNNEVGSVDETALQSLSTGDYKNIVSLLRMFASQLELTVDESREDYRVVYDYCLSSLGAEKDADKGAEKKDGRSNADLLVALQYRDRCSQRIRHVHKRIVELANHLQCENWSEVSRECELELEYTQSFYSQCQLKEITDLANGFCNLERDNENEDQSLGAIADIQDGNAKGSGQSGDMEFF